MKQLLMISILLCSAILFAQAPGLRDTNPVRVTNTWDGSSSTAWSTNANWSQGHYPTVSEDVLIPVTMSGRYPVVTGTYSCNSVDMEIGTSLEIGNGTLNVTHGLTTAGQLRLPNELAELHVEDLTFNSGATMYVPYNGADIYITDDVYFNAGSSINPTYGNFRFSGTNPSISTNTSAAIYNLISSSTNLRHAAGSSPLTIKGNLTVNSSYSYVCNSISAPTTYIYGTVFVGTGGTLQFEDGMVILQGNSANLTTRSGSYFHNLTIAKAAGHSVTMLSNIDVNNDLVINSGSLVPGSYDINLAGDWYNYAGANGFLCYSASGCAVIFDGLNDQYINSSEDFDQIRIDSPGFCLIILSDFDVWCYSLDWISGNLIVEGSLDINSMLDGTLNGSINLCGSLDMHQILGFSVDFVNSVQILGGTFNVYGGTGNANFTSTGTLEIYDGTLSFHDTGITVQDGFTFNFYDGTLKTAGNLEINTAAFDPMGGTIELFGNTNSTISCVYGATLHTLKVNKDSGFAVDVASNLDINGNLNITSGIMRVYWYTLKVAGNLTEASSAYLQAPEGILWLDGTNDQFVIASVQFDVLVVENTSMYVYFNNADFTCNLYDWQDGSLDFAYSTFTAYDLADPGIYGGFYVHNDSVVNLYQDISNPINCNGYMGISSNATVNLYGGNNQNAGFHGTLYMSSGTLDIKDDGIFFGPGLSELISGGIIRVNGSVYSDTPVLDLTGSLVEIYGDNSVINITGNGMLGNLLINGGFDTALTIMTTNLRLSGSLTVQTGYFSTNGNLLRVGQDVDLYDNMELTGDLQLDWGDLTIMSGGRLYVHGTDMDNAIITSGYPLSHYYGFTVQSGGAIWADRTIFEYMDADGVNLLSGSYVNPNYQFHHCTFRNGVSGGTLLKINNTQDLTLFDVTFPENTWGSAYNVSKTNNGGSLHFVLYMGTFGGQSYEQDPNGRINWSQMQIPLVQDLSISYLGTIIIGEFVRLDWDYPIAEATYNIYHSITGPDGPYTFLTNVNTKYAEVLIPDSSVKGFYRVTAVLEQ